MATSTLPATATAWRVHKSGIPPVTLQKDEIPLPKPANGQILVQVHASAVNPIDWKLAALAPAILQKWPHTMGSDFAGVVVGHGEGLSEEQKSLLPIGARVAGLNDAGKVPFNKLPGSIATYTCSPAANVAPLPDRYSFAEGAALPLTGLTAFKLSHFAKADDRVLVLGGSTSVGIYLIQLLRFLGVKAITATASGEKIKLVQSLGADEVIDYRTTSVTTELSQLHATSSSEAFDVVLDTVGDLSIFYASDKFLKLDGVYANVGASLLEPNQSWGDLLAFLWSHILLALPAFISRAPRTYKEVKLSETDMPVLGTKYITSDPATSLKPVIDSEYTFDQAKDAYARLMTNRALGKVVINVQ